MELTVIVPLFNGRAFIAETLDSLARQTLPLTEVIVVDDGSTDDGAAIAAAHPLGPRVLRQDNAGVAVARNRGAVHATTRFVAYVDQDDLWLPSRHARLARFVEAHPATRALVTTERSFYLAADEDRLRSRDEMLHRGADHPRVPSTVSLLDGDIDDGTVPRLVRRITTRELLGGSVSVTTSYLFEREVFLAAGGCATFARSLDDYWALLDLSRLTEVLAVDEPSVLYRIHPTSTTMSTAWSMPLLTSLVAARYGDNLVPLADARDASTVVPLNDERRFWRHQLEVLARDGDLAALWDALALIRLLGCSPSERWRLSFGQARATARAAVRRRVRRQP